MVLLAAGLSARARQNIQLIRGATNRGLTIPQTQALITQKQGRGMRRIDLSRAMNYSRGLTETGVYLRNVGLDRRPNPRRLATSIAQMTKRYRFEVKVNGIDTRTGLPREEFYTIRGNSDLTRREIEEKALEAYQKSQDADNVKYGIRDISFQLETGAFNPDILASAVW